jgi:hypothetical protein
MKMEVAAVIRGIFDAPDIRAAESQLVSAVERYRQSAPKLSSWLDPGTQESGKVFLNPAEVLEG